MGELIARDDVQLRRIESAILRFEKIPPAEQLKKTYLLAALLAERAELVRHSSRQRRSPRRMAVAA
jgi:hypothetical protein